MKEKLLKITAEVKEVYRDPDYEALFTCPHCGEKYREEILDEGNSTITVTCDNKKCGKKFKVKIPKYL